MASKFKSWTANAEQWQMVMDLMEKSAAKAVKSLDAEINKIKLRALKRLKFDANNKLMDVPENIQVRNRLQSELTAAVNEWINYHFGVDSVVFETLPGYEQSTAYTIGKAAEAMAKSFYDMHGVDSNLLVSQSIAEGAKRITVDAAQQIVKVNDLFQRAARSKKMQYQDILDVMTDELGFAKGHAGTIGQGIFSEVYAGHQFEMADQVGTNTFQHTGPFPVYGKNGHWVCQRFYLDIAPLEEWQARADESPEPEVNAQSIIIYGNFGYRCHHQLMAVPLEDVGEVKQMSLEYEAEKAEMFTALKKAGMDTELKEAA